VKKAIVLLSGGLDSTVALYWALAEGFDVRAITFDYRGRDRDEIAATHAIASHARVPLESVAVPYLEEVPGADGYIPGRNIAFYGIACARAEGIGADAVVGGHIAEDPDDFPDSSPAFFRALSQAMRAGKHAARPQAVEIITPLAHLSKEEVRQLARDLHVPEELAFARPGDV
jgi:7-cyano-7-deazaguanine synthase